MATILSEPLVVMMAGADSCECFPELLFAKTVLAKKMKNSIDL